MTIAWLVPALSLLAGAYVIRQNIPLNDLFWPSIIAGIALFLTMALAEAETRLQNISGLFVVAAFSTGLASIFSQYGFTLIGMELTLMTSILALAIGGMFKTKPLILLSTFASLLYLSNSYPSLELMSGFTNQTSSLGAGLMPWAIFGQILFSQKLKSSVLLLASIVAGYVWLGTLTESIPLSASLGLGFTIAAAHFSLGKAGEESGKFGANIHRTFAWVIALSTAFYIQILWLNVGTTQANSFWTPSSLWLTTLGTAMFALFVTSLIRFKSSHISLIGIFIICATVLVIPATTIKPDLIYTAFDFVPGLDAQPGLGLIIGAAIIASGFISLIHGLKEEQFFEMALGATIIGVEALVLFQPARFNADLGVIFIVSLICALCIGGLVAGATTERTHQIRKTLA